MRLLTCIACTPFPAGKSPQRGSCATLTWSSASKTTTATMPSAIESRATMESRAGVSDAAFKGKEAPPTLTCSRHPASVGLSLSNEARPSRVDQGQSGLGQCSRHSVDAGQLGGENRMVLGLVVQRPCVGH